MKKGNLQFKLTAIFLFLAILLSMALSTFSYVTAKKTYTSFYTEKIHEIVCYAATLVDGDQIAAYLESMETDAYYDQLQGQFNVLKKEHDLMYLYIFRPNEKDFTYILEAAIEGDDLSLIAELGDSDEYAAAYKDRFFADLEAKRPSAYPIIIDDQYGYVASAWAPVLDQNGHVAAVVEADLSMHKVLTALHQYIKSIVVIITAGVILFMLILLFAVRKMVAAPLKELTRSALNFASGEKLGFQDNNIKTGDEIEALADAFRQMAGDIEQYVAKISRISVERERIAAELSVAASIQMSLIPRTFPPFPERSDLDIYALIEPAKEVGGDFYDFFMLGEEKLVVVMADVSGKGIPAALFMMVSKLIIKNYALAGMTASEVLYRANNALCENNDSCMFVTAFVGILDMKSGKLNYANAGHNPPILQKKGGPYAFLPVKRGFVLAGMEDTRYSEEEIELTKGDRLFLYTDGVNEAVNRKQALYSHQRIIDTLNNLPAGLNLTETLRRMKADVDRFAYGTEQEDDITMLILEYIGMQ